MVGANVNTEKYFRPKDGPLTRRDLEVVMGEIQELKSQNYLLKERMDFLETITEEKDQKIHELYNMISAIGETLTDLIKAEIFKNREHTRTEFEQIINKRFTDFESEMTYQFNSRQDELKTFLGDTLAISILGAQKKIASKKSKKVIRKGSDGPLYGYNNGQPLGQNGRFSTETGWGDNTCSTGWGTSDRLSGGLRSVSRSDGSMVGREKWLARLMQTLQGKMQLREAKIEELRSGGRGGGSYSEDEYL